MGQWSWTGAVVTRICIWVICLCSVTLSTNRNRGALALIGRLHWTLTRNRSRRRSMGKYVHPMIVRFGAAHRTLYQIRFKIIYDPLICSHAL